jgi:hypothetical protein
MRPGARIPEEGEWVQMGKYATAFRGVWGQVIKVDFNPPPTPVLGGHRVIQDRVVRGASGGAEHTELYILTKLTQGGKRVCVKASPYEIEGALLDERPISGRG